MRFLRPDRINGIDLGNCSQKTRQRSESIHYRLIVSLDQEGDRSQDGDHALQAFALDTADTHDAVNGDISMEKEILALKS
jgi:hypothetical protein